MLSYQEVNEYVTQVKSDISSDIEPNMQTLQQLRSFFVQRFTEVEAIFKQIDRKGLIDFYNKADVLTYTDNNTIFMKGDQCDKYFFLIFGDVSLYSDEYTKSTAKILKTISGGLVFGHKVKDTFQYYAYANSSQVLLLSIKKDDFNDQMEELKKRNIHSKQILLKKFIPNLRSQSEESFDKLKDRFMKLEYPKGTKLIIDGEYDEYIYLILTGECIAIKSVKKIKGLKEFLLLKNLENRSHIVLELYSKSICNQFIILINKKEVI
jgi:CRP-like cAMP-binding protein